MTRTRALLVPFLVVVLVALGGCSSLSATGEKGYISGNGTVNPVSRAEDRGDPIEMAGKDLEGNPVSLEELRGRVVVVNVWGSWCPPCRAEMPDLVAASEETGDDAAYLGINIRDADEAQALAFARNKGMEFPSVYSPDGEALLAFAGTLTPRSIPATVVLDREGRVAASILGPIPSQRTLTALVEDVVADDG